MTGHPWTDALLGGALIGTSASMALFFAGRIAGISGIFGGLLQPSPGDVSWRMSFVGGLLFGGVLLGLLLPETLGTATVSAPMLAVAGLLVGFGTRMGNGCTSGHGVCGLTRFSPRSMVAVATFMGAGMLLASVVHGFGG